MLFRRVCCKNTFLRKLTVGRQYSTQARPYGICLDMDGVLIKGNYVIPETKQALRFLNGDNALRKKIPFILLTNGGGTSESAKAHQLSRLFEVPISPSQIVLSHSPVRSLVSRYRDAHILVVGGVGQLCRQVAIEYGFKNVVIPTDIFAWNPSIWPFGSLNEEHLREAKKVDFSREPIEAIMMFNDSRDWGRDLQIMLDVLRSKDGYIGTLADDTELASHQTPLYFTNPDFEMTGKTLKYELFGKPETPTYRYAEASLESQAASLFKDTDHKGIRHIYAVGDNPAADIAGANAHNWTSILVRTGVFQGKDNDSKFPADYVAQHVFEAVQWMFDREERL
ncbi:9963_t:CDS:10 [Paraglomus brasilianum]|uniref:9963_t:CDS:1 n=1 Tax=Paraglomus brasilianum TaxID=144538 RepID=A0A9N9AWA0_9GLOM|nr:9963_t:CDS:10 [Paraglomus brasilianum]